MQVPGWLKVYVLVGCFHLCDGVGNAGLFHD